MRRRSPSVREPQAAPNPARNLPAARVPRRKCQLPRTGRERLAQGGKTQFPAASARLRPISCPDCRITTSASGAAPAQPSRRRPPNHPDDVETWLHARTGSRGARGRGRRGRWRGGHLGCGLSLPQTKPGTSAIPASTAAAPASSSGTGPEIRLHGWSWSVIPADGRPATRARNRPAFTTEDRAASHPRRQSETAKA